MVRVSSDPASARSSVVTGAEILTRPQLACSLCGGPGSVLHSGLTDRQSSAPGVWSIRQCIDPQCGLMWLDPAPLEQELHKAYESYYTHAGRKSKFDVNASRSTLDKIAGRVAQMAEILAMVIDPRWGEDLVTIIEKSGTACRP